MGARGRRARGRRCFLLSLPLETQLAGGEGLAVGVQELATRKFAKQEVTRAAMDDARRKGLPASEAPPPEAVPETEAALYRTAGRFLRAQLQRIAQKGQVDGSGRLAIDPAVAGGCGPAIVRYAPALPRLLAGGRPRHQGHGQMRGRC